MVFLWKVFIRLLLGLGTDSCVKDQNTGDICSSPLLSLFYSARREFAGTTLHICVGRARKPLGEFLLAGAAGSPPGSGAVRQVKRWDRWTYLCTALAQAGSKALSVLLLLKCSAVM